ncbi:MAG: glycoside hydrolase family 15 protein [Candidatus Korobacteraceae bacterium]
MQKDNPAPGGPGITPKWTFGAKDAIGTAYSVSSRLWYTLANGVVTEVYFPTIDTPQMRDLQFLVTDGETFFHDERRHMISKTECRESAALGYTVTNSDAQGRYSIEKTIIGDPHLPCLLIHTKFNMVEEWQGRLQLYVLCAPHLQIGGWHNNAEVLHVRGRTYLLAYRGDAYLAIIATVPMKKMSVGYVGVNDGWTDLSHNFRMDWEYTSALDGNVAMTGQLDLSRTTEFTLAVGFGHTKHNASSTLAQSLAIPFEQSLKNFEDQWLRTRKRMVLMDKLSACDSFLFTRSVNLLLANEDKLYPGAMIASLSIPWGEDKSDDDLGGYHLVWTRDMVMQTTALLAVGDTATPLRAMIYLAVTQREDGGFYQNFWVDGDPFWTGIQLDEVSFPIILAWRLWKCNGLGNFDPYITVTRACGYLIREGPATKEERWEEAGGYSPSTLASNIAGLICAAEFLEARGDTHTAEFVRTYADFLESHIEKWTVTNHGTLVPGITRHYIRINPAISAEGSQGDEDPDKGVVTLANQKPGAQYSYPANQIVDGGFLELVRMGIRRADDPLMVDSVKVIDAVLKVDTPFGPCWKRYNHDGYGQRDDGSSFDGWGVGRPWPLLTLERAAYELALGNDPEPLCRTVERFTSGVGLIPEQVWDAPDIPDQHMFFGRPTGSAIPLMWAHADFVKMMRSMIDKKVFDLLDPVAKRYCDLSMSASARPLIEIWKMNRQVRSMPAGTLLRVQASSPFSLHWTSDEWHTTNDTASTPTSLGIEYVDIQVPVTQNSPLRFTFFWPQDNQWQEQNYEVAITPAAQPAQTRKVASGE